MKENLKIVTIGAILIVCMVITLLLVLESIPSKLDKACNEFEMEYVYREGMYCLDEDGVLHPIHHKCSVLRSTPCEIRFIKFEVKE